MCNVDKFVNFKNTKVEEAGFTTRTLHVLRKNGCKTMGGVISAELRNIIATRGCGYKTILEVGSYFRKNGYELPDFAKLQLMVRGWNRFDKYKALRYLK